MFENGRLRLSWQRDTQGRSCEEDRREQQKSSRFHKTSLAVQGAGLDCGSSLLGETLMPSREILKLLSLMVNESDAKLLVNRHVAEKKRIRGRSLTDIENRH